MDAVKFLVTQHNRFKRIFSSLSKRNILSRITKKNPQDAVRRRKFDNLCRELQVHEKSEQTIWYPALKKELRIPEEIKHLLKEERSAAKAIKSFKKIKSQAMWEVKFEKFKHDVLHHAQCEETNLFPIAQSNVDAKKLREIGKKLQAFKAKALRGKNAKKKKTQTRKKSTRKTKK